jgi:hypothetical protein
MRGSYCKSWRSLGRDGRKRGCTRRERVSCQRVPMR